jgi:subtilisin family serine protease
MGPLDLIKLSALMGRTVGSRAVAIGLIDGPVNASHPDLAGSNIQQIRGKPRGSCSRSSSIACLHGTSVAGILSARRAAGQWHRPSVLGARSWCLRSSRKT